MSERLLTQNRELRAEGIWNWTLPAWAGRLPDGRTYNTCPAAGACAQVCYARNGAYRFPAVKAKHQRNLLRVLDDLDGWTADMIAEVQAKKRRHRGQLYVRVHDAGDFFSDDYTLAWLHIARSVPDVVFYAYTKEIERFRRLVEPDRPANFLFVYSLGGRQDDLVDLERDRVADVFPDEDAIAAAGWHSQEESDLLAVLGPRLVGIPANRIPGFNRRLAGRRFSQVQATPPRDRWTPPTNSTPVQEALPVTTTSPAGATAAHPVYDATSLPTSGWRWFRPRLATRMVQIGGPATVHTSDGPVTLPPGWRGYLMIGPDGKPIPLPDGAHRVAYEPAGEPA